MSVRRQGMLFQGLVLGCLTALAWLGSDLALFRIRAALDAGAEPRDSVAFQALEEPRPIIDFDTPPRRSPFSLIAAVAPTPAAAVLAPTPAAEELAPSSLPLILRGVWLGSKSRKAWAIIEDPSTHTQALYRAGDALPGGDAVVEQILAKGVKIRRGEEFELLGFPRLWDSASAPVSMAAGLPAVSGDGGSAGLEGIREIGPGRYALEQRLVDHTLSNLTQFLTQARAVPVEGEGFRLRSIKSGSLVEKIGLRNNDMLREVNGIKLTSVEQAFKAFKLLQKETRLSLQVERGGSNQTFEYEIR